MDAAEMLYLGLDTRMTFKPLSKVKVLVSVSSSGCLFGNCNSPNANANNKAPIKIYLMLFIITPVYLF
jgi:hypothetical protein